ncbi:MAG: two-component regulator propeller domain-containing protein [Verrucomicrobiia bacterium]
MVCRVGIGVAVWLLATTVANSAQELPSSGSQYVCDVWQVEDGLPQNSVTSIKQTSDGYLWLGTFNGLARFDGVRFTVFDEGNTPALGSSRIVRLDIGPRGELWIITEQGALTRLSEGHFQQFTDREGLPRAGAAAVIRGPDDATVLLDWAGGIHRLAGEGWIHDPHWEFPRGETITLYTDPDDNAWVWFHQQAQIGRVLEGQIVALEPPDEVQGAGVKSFAPSRARGLWIVLANKIWHYDPEDSSWKQTDWEVPPSMHALTQTLEDRQGNLWVGTYGQGLLRFGSSAGCQRFTAQNGLAHDAVRALWEDREGSIWVGTDGGGLNRLKPRNVVMYDGRHGLTADVVMSVAPDPQDPEALWLGTNGGGFNRFRRGMITPIVLEPHLQSNDFVYGLFADRDGGLWFGSYDEGIWRYHKGVLERAGNRGRWAGKPLLAGLQDNAGTIWLGGGFGLVTLKEGRFTDLHSKLGWSNLVVRALAEDSAGTVYAGTYGMGLARFRQGRWTWFTEADGLSDNHISALYVDRDDTLWIGTVNGGLSRFRDGCFHTATLQDGLPSNSVFGVLEDGLGQLWLGSNRGLVRFRRRELNDYLDGLSETLPWHLLNREDGLNSSECGGGAQPSCCKTPDGKLWFATVKGLAMVDPTRLRSNPFAPPVVIEEVLLDGEQIADQWSLAGDRGAGTASVGKLATVSNPDATLVHLGKNESPLCPLIVPPGKRRLEIHFTALSLMMPHKVRFRYWIEGLDASWIDAGTARTASYSHLPPGQYRFRVIACNNDGIWNETGAALAITVLPQWWQTWAFRAGAVAGVGGLLSWALLLRWRRAQHERAVETAFTQRLIRSQEDERHRIAGELHDSLGQDLLVIKNRALLGLRGAEAPSHSAEQLQEISKIAEQSLEGVREISRNLRPFHIDRLGLTKAIEAMVAAAAGASGFRCNVELRSVDGLLPRHSEIHLYRIIQELVNNIIKHSDASEASLSLGPAHGKLVLTVQDDGRGFDYATVFGRPASEHGLGLTDIAERVRMLGGKLQCDSRPGKGTRWGIEIPVTKTTL